MDKNAYKLWQYEAIADMLEAWLFTWDNELWRAILRVRNNELTF